MTIIGRIGLGRWVHAILEHDPESLWAVAY